MMLLIKNARVYAPTSLGYKDILIANGKFAAIGDNLSFSLPDLQEIDAEGKIVLPGLIDQHIHVTGAGGKSGFASMTSEVTREELIATGTTTTVGLLGTDGTIRAIRALYGKVQALRQEGLSSYMFSGYYGVDSVTVTESIQSDMVFIEPVLGFKIAISDIRSSYPTTLELVRKLREVRTGGLLAQKKGIMHVHLGNLPSMMDPLFEIVNDYHFPIAHISPTHVGRTKDLFDQAIAFAKLGGIIDITTGASKYTDPHKSVLYALEQGVPIEKMTFSSDGHAGLTKLDAAGNDIGFKPAPIDQNLAEVVQLVKQGGIAISDAFTLITTNPAANLGISHKGQIAVGADADMCWFDEALELCDVFAMGKRVMEDRTILSH
ncbi:MAG: beta-aspartyl-peptidase [Schleiferiaceae bacterium]|nr:beta-aspartyl-peptidase [Schleiferiaceae bacterium]